MWKKLLIISSLFISHLVVAKQESITLLKCDDVDFLKEGFLYPVDFFKMSKFHIGKNDQYQIFQLDLKIDPEFRFPKENTKEGFVPYYSETLKISCFNDEIPKLIGDVYHSQKNNDNNTSVYLHKEKGLFLLQLNTKEQKDS